MKHRSAIVVIAALVVLYTCVQLRAQSLPATVLSPANGVMTANITQPITWTPVTGAEAYYLYVGSTAGAKDLVNTGELHSTSYLPGHLPVGQILYARLWTRIAGVWRYNDSTFGSFIATLIAPVDQSTTIDTSQAFQWTPIPNAQAYYLYVGRSVGAKDVVNTGEIQQTSYHAPALPKGVTLYARLWTKYSDHWYYRESSFSSLFATMTSPVDGSTTVDPLQPLQWTSLSGAQAYSLYVGTTLGAKDVLNSGELQQTSYQPQNLPRNQTLYARLWTKVGGVWRSSDSTFGTFLAALTYPTAGLVMTDVSRPFTWTPVPTAQAYYLYVGTTAGANDVVNSGELQQTSYQPRSLPPSQTLYARLWTKVGGVWRSTDSTFGTFLASLTYPNDGLMTTDFALPVTWTSVPTASAYSLWVGTSPGTKDLVDSGEIQRTSFTATGLPKGRVLYARLWTKVGGVWSSTNSTFANMVAALTSPVNGVLTASLTQAFTWDNLPNAEAYYLYVGTTPGARDLVDSKELHQISYPPQNLPRGQPLYARLWTRVAGVWRFSDSRFGDLLARLTYPIDGSVTADLSRPFTWAPVPAADAYYLYVGTTRGAKDLVNTGEIHQTSVASHLFTSQLLYARLWTRISGVWGYNDTSFQFTAATLTYPVDGFMAANPSHAFQWTTVPGAQAYRLSIGTSAGAGDLSDTGETTDTSYLAHGLPTGRTLYARLRTKSADQWTIVDSTFAVAPIGRRVQAGDLVYAGAFRMPGDLDPFGRGFDYGGTAIAFNPANNSLFAVGHLYDQMTAELAIPTPGLSAVQWLPRATILQGFRNALEGHLLDVAPDPSATVYISGQFVSNGQLYISAHIYYGSGQLTSHFVRSLDLSATGSLHGPFKVGPLGTNYYSGYFGAIPQPWQLALGGQALIGDCCLNVISRTSYGPAAFVVDPANIGLTANAAPLVFYPDAHQTLGPWNAQSSLFNGTSEITGVVFPEGTQSVLFVGRQGIGPYCYGEADTCHDLAGGTKGDHAYPYIYQVWAYDAEDLAQVHSGAKQPWDVVPYAVWDLNLPFQPVHGTHVGGVAYDPVTGRIFVSQEFAEGDYPVIHVFTLTTP